MGFQQENSSIVQSNNLLQINLLNLHHQRMGNSDSSDSRVEEFEKERLLQQPFSFLTLKLQRTIFRANKTTVRHLSNDLSSKEIARKNKEREQLFFLIVGKLQNIFLGSILCIALNLSQHATIEEMISRAIDDMDFKRYDERGSSLVKSVDCHDYKTHPSFVRILSLLS